MTEPSRDSNRPNLTADEAASIELVTRLCDLDEEELLEEVQDLADSDKT
jgi:hypothetical protein